MATPPLSQIFVAFYRQLFVTPRIPEGTSFEGQFVIVTGSNIGLGLEAARHITKLGAAKVILAVRSTEKGEAAKRDIEASTDTGEKGTVEVWELDLQSFDSVKAFAQRAQALPRLDVLLENAAIATETWRLPEGHESTITTNVISTFLLALLLLPKLRETSIKFNTRPHLTIVSSDVHGHTDFPEGKSKNTFETLRNEKEARFSPLGERYAVSKLLEVLVVRYWGSESGPMGPNYPVILNTVNPGLCHSALAREMDGFVAYAFAVFSFVMARSTVVGSRTLVHAAAANPETHGEYLSECRVTPTAEITQGEKGMKLSKKVWSELKEILEGIEPGVTKNF